MDLLRGGSVTVLMPRALALPPFGEPDAVSEIAKNAPTRPICERTKTLGQTESLRFLRADQPFAMRDSSLRCGLHRFLWKMVRLAS